MKQNAIFCDIDGTFVEAFTRTSFIERKTIISISYKPMSLDPLYWAITETSENNSEPLSFRSWGAFTCPALPLDEVTFENDSSCVDQLLQKAQKTVIEKSENFISKLSETSFSNEIMNHNNQIERGAYAISLVTSLIDEKDYEEAHSIAKRYAAGELECCHSHTHVGKDFNELAIEWLSGNGYVT